MTLWKQNLTQKGGIYLNDKNRKIAIIIAAILGCVGLFYLGGMLGQLLGNYAAWMDSGGVSGESTMKPVSWNPLICFPAAFSGNGIKGILMILLIAGAIFAYVKLHDKFDGKQHDPRGFARSKSGIYGTASWMDEKEMKEVLEISPVPDAKGTILGEYNGKAVCMPEDTRLNRHIAVFGASGTMKSRAIIRNALFQALRRSESVIVTDSKGELYADTSEMFRNAGYDVKIYNLVSPEHSDSWNCMSDLNGDTLMAQVLTNVIIGNTSSGKGDHFWDNGEGNLLKALILLVDQDRTRSPDMKHLSAVYQLLTQNSERQLTAMFDKLPLDHPARAPFNLFAQSSDTVRSGIILGLGTRLQVLQNQAVQRITSRSDIVSAIRAGIFIDLFGVESYIPLKELSYQRWMDAAAHFQPGQRILVKVLDVDRSDRDHVRVSASVKQAGENPYEKALRRYSVGNRYVGTVSMVDTNGVFVALDGGIDCLCSYPKRGRPPRGARVTVRILGINHETNRIWGAITHIAMPH